MELWGSSLSRFREISGGSVRSNEYDGIRGWNTMAPTHVYQSSSPVTGSAGPFCAYPAEGLSVRSCLD